MQGSEAVGPRRRQKDVECDRRRGKDVEYVMGRVVERTRSRGK